MLGLLVGSKCNFLSKFLFTVKAGQLQMILATVSFEKSLILKHLVTVFAGIRYLVNFMHVCLVFSQTLRGHKCLSTYNAQIVSSHDSAVCSNNVAFQSVLHKVFLFTISARESFGLRIVVSLKVFCKVRC